MRIEDVLQRIQGEFVEMPGLRLTAAQAQRLWGLEREVCTQLLSTLVDAKFLSRTRDGAFIRTDGAGPTSFANRRAVA
jgi:Fic family protein